MRFDHHINYWRSCGPVLNEEYKLECIRILTPCLFAITGQTMIIDSRKSRKYSHHDIHELFISSGNCGEYNGLKYYTGEKNWALLNPYMWCLCYSSTFFFKNIDDMGTLLHPQSSTFLTVTQWFEVQGSHWRLGHINFGIWMWKICQPLRGEDKDKWKGRFFVFLQGLLQICWG